MSGGKSWYRIESARANGDVATVYLHDEIGLYGVTSGDFIHALGSVTQPNLKLHVNSPGGSVDDGIAIFNALKSRNGTVSVFVDALAASIASVIAMAASPGQLTMAPHSRMMIHEAMALGVGFAEDFEKIAVRLRDVTKNIATIYQERAGQKTDYWLGKMATETWFTDQQAVDEGLADVVGRDSDQNAFKIAANFNLSRFRNAPPELLLPAPRREVASLDFLAPALISAGWTPPVAAEEGGNAAENSEIEADLAPEGDPEPSLTPQEQAKADLERRLALIRL